MIVYPVLTFGTGNVDVATTGTTRGCLAGDKRIRTEAMDDVANNQRSTSRFSCNWFDVLDDNDFTGNGCNGKDSLGFVVYFARESTQLFLNK